jgi:hypothetical protein
MRISDAFVILFKVEAQIQSLCKYSEVLNVVRRARCNCVIV